MSTFSEDEGLAGAVGDHCEACGEYLNPVQAINLCLADGVQGRMIPGAGAAGVAGVVHRAGAVEHVGGKLRLTDRAVARAPESADACARDRVVWLRLGGKIVIKRDRERLLLQVRQDRDEDVVGRLKAAVGWEGRDSRAHWQGVDGVQVVLRGQGELLEVIDTWPTRRGPPEPPVRQAGARRSTRR